MELFFSYACDPVKVKTTDPVGEVPRSCSFRMTIAIARMIKQDKLLQAPPCAGDIRREFEGAQHFIFEWNKKEAEGQFKFMLIYFLQIFLQYTITNRYALNGFWAIGAPILGAFDLFANLMNWHYYMLPEKDRKTKCKFLIIFLIQITMTSLVWIEFFIINAKPEGF